MQALVGQLDPQTRTAQLVVSIKDPFTLEGMGMPLLPGAFVEVAASYDDYAEAMKRKLLREIFGSGYASLR